MKNDYPWHVNYERLYKWCFNKKKFNAFVAKIPKLKKNPKILDLCGGNGRLSRKLKAMYPKSDATMIVTMKRWRSPFTNICYGTGTTSSIL